ncbi:MAG TPA: ABC transporter permease [Acidimicrobiia bacterium]|nr:ABC transporter permease [Acidimicrobiia bacterium]
MQDLRFAGRALRRNPLFAATAVATLALAIGVNSAVFSLVHAALFAALPFPNVERVMSVSLVMPFDPRRPSTRDMVWSYPKYEAFRTMATPFEAISLVTSTTAYVADEQSAERVTGEMVSAPYFEILGIRSQRGRTFVASDDSVPSGPRVVVVSDRLWHESFGSDPRAVGRSITLNSASYTIVGVAAPEFLGLSGTADFWIPVHVQSANALSYPWNHSYGMIALLRRGITPDEANAAVMVLGRAIDRLYPNKGGGEHPAPWGARAQSLNDSRTNVQLRRVLYVLWLAVGCVLLIAAANVAGMQLARASGRQREIAVRVALGASRARVMRQLLTESLVLTAAGTGVGILLGGFALDALLASQSNSAALQALTSAGLSNVLLARVHLDGIAVAVSIVLALTVGVLFGLLPAAHASRTQLSLAMRGDQAPAARTAGHPVRGRELLVVAEITLAYVLIVGAALFGRTVQRLLSTDPGFDSHGVVTARISIPSAAIPIDSTPAFASQLLQRVAAVPGVTTAALTDCLPLSGGCSATFPEYLDRPQPVGGLPLVGSHVVTPQFFATLQIPLKRGRVFDATDRAAAPHVMVISESMASMMWPGEDPIGKHLRASPWGANEGAVVIGVVGDVRFGAIDSVPRPDVYAAMSQVPRSSLVILARSRLPLGALATPLRNTVRTLAARMPLYSVMTFDDKIAGSIARPRFGAQMLTAFALLALVLAGVGIYGLVAFVVARRTREIGIRIALGAERATVMKTVLARGLALAASGIAAGIVLSLGLTRFVGSLLYEAPTIDAFAYGVSAVVFVVVTTAACIVPARRAAGVDPVIALRAE